MLTCTNWLLILLLLSISYQPLQPAVQLTPPNLFLPHVRLMCYVTAVAVMPPPYHCYHFLKTLPRYNQPLQLSFMILPSHIAFELLIRRKSLHLT